MAYVKYFQVRTAAKNVTGADAVELIGSSTRTVGLAHPPHPHAHIHKEGFIHAPLSAKNKQDVKHLKSMKKNIGPKGVARLQNYAHRQFANHEGLHLDPAKRVVMHKDHRLADPVKKGKVNLYIDRKVHSQFEDTEVAVMALVHSLNTTAGAKALAWLTGIDKRVVVTSATAAKMLNKGAVTPPGLKVPPSAHPLRGAVPMVIERGKGIANVAPTPSFNIGSIVSIFDYDAGGFLTLVTHYPTQVKAPGDEVEFKALFTAANGDQFFKGVKKSPFPSEASSAVRWSDPAPPTLAASASAGVTCVHCGAVHGRFKSVWNLWFKCNRCGDVYCATHGTALAAAVPPNPIDPAARVCGRVGCNGQTTHIR